MPQRRSISLRLSLTLVFVTVTILVGGAIAAEWFRQTRDLILRQTDQWIEATADRFTQGIERTYHPIDMTLELLSHTSSEASPGPEVRLQQVPVLLRVLQFENHVRALMVGNASGEFFTVGRVTTAEHIATLQAPEHSVYYVTLNALKDDGSVQSQRHFLDADYREIERRDLGPAQYDPRTRPWYQEALTAPGLIITSPYVYASEATLGITLARANPDHDQVFAADITLHRVSEELSRQQVTPGTVIALYEPDGSLLAFTDESQLYARDANGELTARRVQDLTDSPITAIAPRLLTSTETQLDFTYQDRAWMAVTRRIGAAQGVERGMAILIPLDELLADAMATLRETLLVAGLLLLLAIPLIAALARSIARPLAQLVEDARRIRHFDFADSEPTGSRLTEIGSLERALDSMRRTIRQFLDLIEALAAESDFDELLRQINRETRRASGASATVLYLLDEAGSRMVPAWADLETGVVPMDQLPGLAVAPAAEAEAEAESHPILRAFHQRQSQTAPIHQADAGAGAEMAPLFQALGCPKLLLQCVPLASRTGETAGVLVLVDDLARVSLAKAAERARFVEAMSGFAAVSIESRHLIRMQKALLSSFIKVIAGAIDAKSPYTGGHCERVPILTEMFARAAAASDDPRFKDFHPDVRQWEAISIAAWLHDCGKVTTPEYVVDKSTKLETLYDRIHEVRMRFEVLKREAEVACWRSIAEGGERESLLAALSQAWQALDEDFHFVATCNRGSEDMGTHAVERLERIARRRWKRTLDDRLGVSWEEARRKARTPASPLPVEEPLLADRPDHLIERPPQEVLPADNPWGFLLQVPEWKYNRGELHNLKTRRGTLTDEERYMINDHIVQTIIMLEQLPFPRHLREVPALAGGHHEKMDGTGYPRRLHRAQMPLVARMMAIADIFEALTAADRPYKTPKTLSEAITIMARMRREQHIDADLFELFLRSGVYLDYARRFLDPQQIDPVDIHAALAD